MTNSYSSDSDCDHELEESMYYSVESGDLVLVKALLDQGYSPNYKFEGSNQLDKSVLHLACEKGHEECAKMLIERGAKINGADGWFQTPLMYAVCTERENMVKLLLQLGANPNKQDRFCLTALHYAVRNESTDCLKLLVESGADLNVREHLGRTPLFEAVTTDDKQPVVKYLLDSGCLVNVTDYREKRSPLSSCILQTKKDTAKYVELLLSAGADVNCLDRYAHTPLSSLIMKNFSQGELVTDCELEIAKMLLSHGSKVNLHCEVKYWYQFHGTALKLASDRGCPALMELLLMHGANPDITDMKNVSPIHCASFKGHLQSAKLLIYHNASLNKFAEMKFANNDVRQVTPFICAVIRNNPVVAELLYKAGSDAWLQELWDSNDLPELLLDEMFTDSLKEKGASPRSLFDETRIDLRRNIGHPFWSHVDMLPLPKQLKLSLGFPELTL